MILLPLSEEAKKNVRVSVHVRSCVRVCTCVHMCVCTYVHVCALSMRVCACVHEHACVHVCALRMRVCACVHVRACVHVCMRACVVEVSRAWAEVTDLLAKRKWSCCSVRRGVWPRSCPGKSPGASQDCSAFGTQSWSFDKFSFPA